MDEVSFSYKEYAFFTMLFPVTQLSMIQESTEPFIKCILYLFLSLAIQGSLKLILTPKILTREPQRSMERAVKGGDSLEGNLIHV